MLIRKVHKVLTPSLIELESGDKLRLISIDDSNIIAPPGSDEELFYTTSCDYLGKLVVGKMVRIEFDKRMLDPDGNLLAYVSLNTSLTGTPTWFMINKNLIIKGWTDYRVDEVNKVHSLTFEMCLDIAKVEKKGIWNV